MNKIKINENEFFIGEKSIYVTHYKGTGDRYAVFAAPLFEEMARTRKLMVNAARYLAHAGVHVIRFDYYGTGLSYGKFEEFSFEQARRDLISMIDYCRQQGAQSVSLLGFRFGAFLAGELCSRPDIDRTVLWEPVLDLGEYLEENYKSLMVDQIVTYGTIRFSREELMQQLKRDGKLFVNGYAFSLKADQEFRSARVLQRDDLHRAAVILWRRSVLNRHPFLSEMKPTICTSVKTAWDHIKFIEHNPKSLIEATVQLMTSSGADNGEASR